MKEFNEQRLIVPIELIELDPENTNDHDDSSIEVIRASLEKFGQQKPIVVRLLESGQLRCVAGNGQRVAAELNGMAELWVTVTNLDELSAAAFGVADNETARNSQQNQERLAKLLVKLRERNFPVEYVGIAPDKLKDLISRASVQAAKIELDEKVREHRVEIVDDQVDDKAAKIFDDAKRILKKWNPQPGQIWEIPSNTVQGECHRIVCGDSTDWKLIKLLMQKRRADAVVTDSPYGIEREGIANDDPEKLRELFDGVLENLPVENGVIVNFQSPNLALNVHWLDAIRNAKHKLERLLWMHKPNDCTFPWRGWIMTGEAVFVSSIGVGNWNEVEPFSHDTYTVNNTGSHLPKDWGKVHASVKDLATIADLVARVSKPGQLLYEPFAGSGTTIHACEIAGRLCYGIDLKPENVAVSLERMSELAGLKPRKYEAPRLLKNS